MEQNRDARWMGVGRAGGADSRAAAIEAARAAVTGTDPKLLLVFAAITHDPALVQEGIREVVGDVPVLGCTTHGEIGPGGPADGSVVVAAIGGTGFSVSTAVAEQVSGRQREAGAEVARCAADVAERTHRVLLMITDGFTRDQESILRGAYSVLGAGVPLFGGASADGWRMTGTYLMANGKVLTDAVLAASIGSDAPIAVSVRHGWRKVGEPMIVTHSVKGDLHTLDDKPALTAYLDRLNAPPEAYTDPAVFDQFNRSRPIGIRRRGGEEVRHVNSISRLRETWLRSSGEVPEGGLIWVMQSDRESTLEAANEACRAAIDALDGAPPLGLLAFDCISRSRVLGDEGTREEVERMLKVAAGAPLAGFYTWGEIARTRGITGYHNQTLAVLAVG